MTKLDNTLKATLIRELPLLKCGNNLEFKQRLQWLSEGMLRNHLESISPYKQDQDEMTAYTLYKAKLQAAKGE